MLRLNAMQGKRLPLLVFLILAVCGGCRRSPEVRKAKFMESGKAFMQAKDYSRAVLQFRNAAQVGGKDPEPYYQMALAFLSEGELAGGARALQQAIKLNPNYAPAKLKLAELKTLSDKTNDVREAETALEKIVGASPDDSDALSALAFAEIRLGNLEDAMKNLEAALQKSPQNLKASLTMARVKAGNGDSKGAQEVLETAVRQAPKSANPLVALASFYAGNKKWPEAEHSLDQALQIDPKNDGALVGLAMVEMQTKQMDKAEQTFAKLSALPIARYKPVHAQFLFQEGKHDAAITEFAKLAKDNPQDRAARTRLVTAYWAADRKAEAEKVLSDTIKNAPKDTDALMQRAQIELATRRYTEAQTDVDQVLRYRPAYAVAHYAKAKVYQARGQHALERQELDEALRLDKKLLPARLQLAQALIQQRDGKAALALLESTDVTEAQQKSLPVFVLRISALRGMRDFQTARTRLDAALKQVKNPDLLLQDALLKYDMKDYTGALASADSVLKTAPEDLRALELMALVYGAQKQVALGTQKIRQYAASQPKSARVQKFLGDWLVATGDRSGALQAYAAAKQLDPQLASVDMAMVPLYIADNKNDAARQILARILQTGDNNAVPSVWMGVLEERAGNFESAATNYRKALSIDGNNVMALNNLAFLLAEHGQPQQLDEALKLAQQVRALVPRNGNIDDTMGWVYYKKGIFSSAVQQFQDAVSQDDLAHAPSPLHLYHLGMAYIKNGDQKHGNEKLNMALRLDPNLPEAKEARTLLAQTKTASN